MKLLASQFRLLYNHCALCCRWWLCKNPSNAAHAMPENKSTPIDAWYLRRELIRIRMWERWAHIGDGKSQRREKQFAETAPRQGGSDEEGGSGWLSCAPGGLGGENDQWNRSRWSRWMDLWLQLAAGSRLDFVGGFASGFSGFPATRRTRRHSGHGAN